MSFFSRLKNKHNRRSGGGAGRRGGGLFSGKNNREENTRVEEHLRAFTSTRKGVEAYFEPATPREEPALLLIARDGEWTRRKVQDLKVALSLAEKLGLPFYEVQKTGYPKSMREWNERHRAG
ncbi:Uncharacterised protein [Actinobaculum suis]|uniref:Uncharacterized protein n=1 Tax=Actinobaculum suis TaxID=1657 RepID=A0A1B9BC37_9ACTO|nr:hypothetical protein [Actinobaculum suis]OCA93926.1 hypothetical protein ACU20_07275 [Actinobaculum suis]OCA94391.1 hypothetical protein ACU21_06660 [Actinobaculum suis]VDG76654.1 Uncharacterised protein [Actinobaculum suis]